MSGNAGMPRWTAWSWRCKVEGIDLTLAFLRQKREETKRLARIAASRPGHTRHRGAAMI